MKKIIYYLSVIWFIFLQDVTMSAQVGVKAGIGISDIAFKTFGQSTFLGYDNNGVIHNLPRMSYQAGIYTSFELSAKWKIQPELIFAGMGIDYSTEFLYDDITYKISIDYLQIPILLEHLLNKREKSQLGVYMGPYAALKLNANKQLEIEGVKESISITNVEDHDFGVLAGCSYQRKMNSGLLRLDLRIGFGLVNMMDAVGDHHHDFSYTPDEYARNVGGILSVGYSFNDLFNKNGIP